MKNKTKILIIEDETAIRTGLIDVFLYNGYDVSASGDGQEGLHKALTKQFDLVLLDVMLPSMNGFEVCQRIREQDKDLAIIMLTAKTSDEEIIHGFDLGADDYVNKPFSIAQLLQRVKAVLRRTLNDTEQSDLFSLGSHVTIDIPNLRGQRLEQELIFTRREIEVLQYLRSHSTRPVPREELLNKVWGYGKSTGIETRTVDIHISKLRRKIELKPKDPVHLITVRGEGYKLVG